VKQLKHKAGQESTLSEKHQGSCWGVSAAAAGSERLCIATGKPEHFLSARDLISCCTNCGYGCQSGWPSNPTKPHRFPFHPDLVLLGS
jgi:hypothetical protein